MSTQAHVMRFLAGAFAEVADAWTDETYIRSFLRELGWSLASVPAPLAALGPPATALAALWRDAAFSDPTLEQAAELATAIDGLWVALRGLETMTDPPEVIGANLASELGRAILDYWIVEALDRHGAFSLPLLELLGVVEVRYLAEAPPRRAYFRRRVHWDRIPDLLTDPAAGFRERFAWGAPDFDADGVLVRIRDLLSALRCSTALVDAPPNEVVAAGGTATDQPLGIELQLLGGEAPGGARLDAGVRFLPVRPATAPPGLALVPYASTGLGTRFPIDDHVAVEIDATFDVQGGVVLAWLPATGLRLITEVGAGGTTQATGHAAMRLVIDDPANQDKRLIDAFGFQLIARTTQGVATLALEPSPELSIEGELKDGRLRWDTREAPSVIAAVLGERTIEASATLALGWSSRRGFYFRGGASVGTVLPASLQLGPVALRGVRVAVEPLEGGLALSVGVDGSVAIGPVTVGWEGFGVRARLRAGGPAESPIDVGVALAEPREVALAIEAGPVAGGGLISHDATGRYTGMLALQAFGVALSALGVLERRAGTGYSLVAAISAQFSPVPLGLGFTLSGVGGLVGIHRRVDTDALRAALRGPGLGSIFFSADPAGQAARLQGELAAYFPAAPGRHVIGPAARLGWGSPALVEGELAVLLELPSPVRTVLIGHVQTALPTKEHPIIELHVDVVGELDPARRSLAIDASLRDSKVAGFPITGDFAFRMSWGDPPSVVLSVGGFHSQFRPPPGFPALRRIRIPIGADDDPRLDLQGFLALTSNTAQVGAQVELYASAGPLNIKGSLGFEALLQLSPFRFRVDLWAGVALRRGTTTLAGVHLDGTLTGPSPWRIAGEACLSLWFIDLCVDFDATFGVAHAFDLPARLIWPPLQEALQRAESWSTALPVGVARAVTTAPPLGEPATARIDPAAAMTVRQKIAPLDRRITRFGEVAPEGPDRFQLAQVVVGAAIAPYTTVEDWFAPAQFEALSDADRLSRPGFEPMVGGIAIAATAIAAGSAQIAPLIYETIVLPQRERVADFRPTRAAQLLGTAFGAAARAPLRTPAAPPPVIRLDEERYVIASTADLSARLDLAPPASRGAIELALAAHLAATPGARGALQVVPHFEVL